MEEYENDHGFESGSLSRDKDRPYLTDSELGDASREQLLDMYHQLQRYIDDLQQKNYGMYPIFIFWCRSNKKLFKVSILVLQMKSVS